MIEYVTTWVQLKLDGLKTDRRAVTALEYGLIAAIMSVGVVAGVTALGNGFRTELVRIGGLLK